MSETYFFDTYALFEIIEGNSKYEKYRDKRIITSIFNLAELNYNLKKHMPKEKADKYVEDYLHFVIEVTIEDIKNAMDFKIKNKNLSIPDAIGYTLAKKHNVKFLTGDSDFESLDNVEFVRK